MQNQSFDMNIVLLGPPGVGKGTEAALLSQRLSIDHISTGDMLRREVGEDTELGKKARSFMNQGKLVPDDIIMAMVKKRLHEPGLNSGFVLDGIPRTLAQAEALEEILKESKSSLNFAIDLEAGEEVVIERLSGRRICKKCQAIYHIVNMKPAKEGICDRCGGELYQREDDKVATIKKRLKVYQEETKDLIEFYRKKGILLTINAEGEAEETFGKIAQNVKTQSAKCGIKKF
jgi:adenylate kinase